MTAGSVQGTALRQTVLAWLVVSVLWPSMAAAQSGPGAPDPATVHIRVGPFWIKPTLALTDAGIDTNVFNAAEAAGPEKDFTMTFTPAANVWMGIRSTWITGAVKEDLVWYKKFTDERSANTSYSLGWIVPLSRLTLAAGGSWIRSHQRPGFEIDAREKRAEQAYNASVEFRLLSKTFVGIRGERRVVDFDEAATFQGLNLHDELNRHQTSEMVTLRHDLTPLTSLTVDVGTEQDRFDVSPLRNADSTQTTFGLAFAPDALIAGSAKVGYRRFSPLQADLPGYSGSTAAVNISYLARETTRLSLQVNRDIQFSYDVDQPYYLLTGFTANVTQQIFGPLDVEGRYTSQRLSYRDRIGAVIESPDRVDHVRIVGGGIGYHVGEDLRVAFNVDHQQRDSPLADRSYRGLRYGTAVTYGF